MSEQSDARAPLSVLVPVKNEAANLRDCLASVSFAEEIVVVDSASTDGYSVDCRVGWGSGCTVCLERKTAAQEKLGVGKCSLAPRMGADHRCR